MALHFSSSICSSTFSRSRFSPVRAELGNVAVKSPPEEEKLKLGGSDLKVTKLGIGAWSWGDTSYWNDFSWDGINPLLALLLDTILLKIQFFYAIDY